MNAGSIDPAAIEDWVAYLQDLIARPATHRELQIDGALSAPRAIAMFAERLDPVYRHRLLDAALDLLERGTPGEVEVVGIMPFGADETSRVVDVLASRGHALPQPLFDMFLGTALDHASHDPRVIAALEDRARSAPEEGTRMLLAAQQALPEWVAASVGVFATAENDPSGAGLASLIVRQSPDRRRELLDAIAAAGPDFVARAVAGLTRPDLPEVARGRVRPDLAQHPVFRAAAV